MAKEKSPKNANKSNQNKLNINTYYSRKKLNELFKANTRGDVVYVFSIDSIFIFLENENSIKNEQITFIGPLENKNAEKQSTITLNDALQNKKEIYIFVKEMTKGSKYLGKIAHSEKYKPSIKDSQDGTQYCIEFTLPLKRPNNDAKQLESKLSDKNVKKGNKQSSGNTVRTIINKKVSKNDIPLQKEITQTSKNPRNNKIGKESTFKEANGNCELCDQPAPFLNEKNEGYLEVHHILWLEKGGPDSKNNMAALCPNCHKKMHIRNEKDDVEKLWLKRNNKLPSIHEYNEN